MLQLDHSMLLSTLNMFAFLAFELTLLFIVISFFVGLLQQYIPPSKIQSVLSSKRGKGYIIAAFLGAITPFCSCSTMPFLKGLLRAKAGFGTMMVFLFASPLINPIIIGLFVFTFGLKVAIFYFLIALSVSIIAGFILEKLGFEKYIKSDVYTETKASGCHKSTSAQQGFRQHLKPIWHSTCRDFKKVFPYLIGGIAVGSVIYGFLPATWISSVASDHNPFAIPIAAVVGIPLYIRAEAVIPLSAVLAAKGMSLGAVMALIIGSAGASLTEVILLKSIFKSPLIMAFLGVIISMAISAGWLYQFIF